MCSCYFWHSKQRLGGISLTCGLIGEVRALWESPEFGKLLQCLTALEVTGRVCEARRFRAGLDYSVAHYGAITKADPRP